MEKMYITYDTSQHFGIIYDKMNGYQIRAIPLTIPNDLPKADFMPTKLVRISDMTVVDGSQVNEGYCAFSYSWNQSGDMVLDETTGKYKRIDEGKHKIISYDSIYPDMAIPEYKINTIRLLCQITTGISKLKKIYPAVYNITDDHNYYFSKTIQNIKFEGIIQRICQQFSINYIIKKKSTMKYVTCIICTKMPITPLRLYLNSPYLPFP
ncbi:hypothetical protein BDA99DRAFT_595076 [Phascolomyces articulosus]|uniref:Uncharacterized protein n=1 Tax=Phascolomyces articulosus TaxID=60185 RepID=A0AAD5KIH7_9FUNG|nr:hypothetical protein BDA99DRAFT_595076 [Phascolomyces articulosus]